MTTTGLIVPLRSEAFYLLGRRGWRSSAGFRRLDVRRNGELAMICICSGVGPEKAAAAASALIETGAELLAVAGTAGGLHPALRPGDLVLADRILKKEGEKVSVVGETAWRHARELLKPSAGIRILRGAVLTCSVVIETAAEKQYLHQQTRALAVDMESAAVVQAAARQGLPAMVIRAVCDTSTESLPREILDTIDHKDRVRAARLAGALLHRPALIPALVRLNTQFKAAMAALKKKLPLLSDYPM